MKIAIIAAITTLLLGNEPAMARSIGFYWDANTDDANGYNLYLRPSGTTEWSTQIIDGRETTAIVIDLPWAQEYEAALSAVVKDQAGGVVLESELTAIVTVPAEEGTPKAGTPTRFYYLAE